MKKIFFISCLLLVALGVSAQKTAYVDTEYILKHIPDYKSSLTQIEGLSKQYQKEVDDVFKEVDAMYRSYQADQVLLTDDMRKRRENDIIEKEKKAKELQRQRFGPEGDLFQTRTKLLKPIQEKVSTTVAEVAKNKYIDFVFDKSSESTMMIYASANYDISNDVIIRLGFKPGTLVK
ncbi:OmpH family outer membrane protein [Pedobacter chitinilyticus]|jgi:outer membrane protein|uniref:OmpH family outer membrane protein n=1 Tax=Pedobacter chitinilyticus TaxID=2233776 RepID=A0A3S3PSM8_9SPHI|nr:OmpH family outer membrane protein [Pedobacter chitinilyticus]RWU04958.1 OmpH family outer membrane protein [Pedobacter chitinilyticus]|eukprot:Mycagemm_TRINITY_DN10318_c5_g5::TRINITY_DN10318_c5_g5_i1::g.1413::m.1413 type:complete len:177 gc:universal TRINITY_DN10318_c5_g5_i1:620-90(-)